MQRYYVFFGIHDVYYVCNS